MRCSSCGKVERQRDHKADSAYTVGLQRLVKFALVYVFLTATIYPLLRSTLVFRLPRILALQRTLCNSPESSYSLETSRAILAEKMITLNRPESCRQKMQTTA